jgi:sorting nexin-1/2
VRTSIISPQTGAFLQQIFLFISTSLMQYTSYKVTTRTSNPKYKACNSGDSVVMRRFSEFHMLFTKLHEEYPGVIVPPCPEKNQLENFRKSGTFIEQRRQALEVFINKVCSHRILKHSDLLRMFLEADETAWQMEMQKLKSGTDNSSILGKVSQFASDIVHSTKNLTKGQSDDQGEDAEYLQVSFTLHVRMCTRFPAPLTT